MKRDKRRVSQRVKQLKAANKYKAELAKERRIVRELADQGYTYKEILEELEDEGYDEEDIQEALLATGYDWRAALIDAIKDQAIDLQDAPYYADLLGMYVHEIYDMYYDSP